MFTLALIAVPVLEVLVFIEVGRVIGWPAAIVLLLGTSLLGARVVRTQGRVAIEAVSLAFAQRRVPGRAAVDGALGFLAGSLLLLPGFLTDALGALLMLPPTRKLARFWLSRHYAGRVVSFLAGAVRFVPGERGMRPADVDSTAVDDDLDELGR